MAKFSINYCSGIDLLEHLTVRDQMPLSGHLSLSSKQSPNRKSGLNSWLPGWWYLTQVPFAGVGQRGGGGREPCQENMGSRHELACRKSGNRTLARARTKKVETKRNWEDGCVPCLGANQLIFTLVHHLEDAALALDR